VSNIVNGKTFIGLMMLGIFTGTVLMSPFMGTTPLQPMESVQLMLGLIIWVTTGLVLLHEGLK